MLIDLSHTIHDGMITYKGLPPPRISDHLSREESRKNYAPGTEFHIGRIEMVANTGTYLDTPFHRFAGTTDLAALELESVANLEGIVVRCAGRGTRAVTESDFEGLNVQGKAQLVETGWDQHWRTDTYTSGEHPNLTGKAAAQLANAGAALVGIDSYNIDDTSTGERPVHTTLLGKGIPVVEHLRGLSELPDRGFRFFAVPAKVAGMGTFPVRAFALIEG
jgi:arylformamidase